MTWAMFAIGAVCLLCDPPRQGIPVGVSLMLVALAAHLWVYGGAP